MLYKDAQQDPNLEMFRRELLTTAARALDKARMVRFDDATGFMHITGWLSFVNYFFILIVQTIEELCLHGNVLQNYFEPLHIYIFLFLIICITLHFNSITDLGRIASQFYIKYDTVEIFNEFLKSVMNEGDILAVISQSSEFAQLKVGKTWSAPVL